MKIKIKMTFDKLDPNDIKMLKQLLDLGIEKDENKVKIDKDIMRMELVDDDDPFKGDEDPDDDDDDDGE